jgi:hypothetical protein
MMMRGDDKGFFRTLGDAFRVSSYSELSEKHPAQPAKYFLLLMILATILMFIAAIPAFINLSNNVGRIIDNFNYLSIKINASSKGPVIIFPDDRFKEITIDWESNATSLSKGKMLLAKDRMIKKILFGSEYTNLTGFSNVLEHRDFYKNSFMLLVLFLIPSMVVGAYVFFGIKFAVLALLLAVVGFITARTIRFNIDFRNCFNIAFYAATPAVIIEMVTFAYNLHIPYFRIEWVGYAISVFYFVMGLKKCGYFEGKRDRHGELMHRRRYLEVRE